MITIADGLYVAPSDLTDKIFALKATGSTRWRFIQLYKLNYSVFFDNRVTKCNLGNGKKGESIIFFFLY